MHSNGQQIHVVQVWTQFFFWGVFGELLKLILLVNNGGTKLCGKKRIFTSGIVRVYEGESSRNAKIRTFKGP